MKILLVTKLIAVGAFIFCLNEFAVAQQKPHLEKRGQATQLMVNEKPFLILGGELYNSSSSSSGYMDSLWKPLRDKNLNTALVAVSWELIEPVEGKFDFSLVDSMLKGARENKLHLVLLWFGSWKNGLSHYVPEWVKKDTRKYPRIVLENGRSTETISALSTEAEKADAKAFAALMNHVKIVDAQQGTVIMVQVENEVGIIGGTRDHSAMANAAFAKQVPTTLIKGMENYKSELQPSFKKLWEAAGSKSAGTWADVFGNNPSADEAFMAWYYAGYINTVAKAGKAQYDIPMYVNTWVVQPQDKKPGDYPSGGPQAHVHDIWRIAAPDIDIKAPDIYLPDFKGITALYYHNWNPLFIPESFSGDDGAANAFYTIGKYSGIGYSPFGIDARETTPLKAAPLTKAYHVLAQLTPEILAAQAAGKITAVKLNSQDSVQYVEAGGYKITVTLRKSWGGVTQASKGYGLIISSGTDEFTIAGSDIDVMFAPSSPGLTAGLASVREGTYENAIWKPGRLLNGDDIMISYNLADEAAAGRTGTGAKFGEEPAILKVKLYKFK